jgi:glutathione S-transferase
MNMSNDFITALRQNHALEHAAIAVLISKLGLHQRMVGQATTTGFYIYGNVPTEAIQEAATEGLARLQRGESELAVSPFCGTNISVAGIMAGIACLLALGGKNRGRRLPLAILAATWAIIAARPIGRIAQKYLTTSADLTGIRIKRITRRGTGTRILHKIEITRALEAE